MLICTLRIWMSISFARNGCRHTLYKNFGFDSGPRDKMNVLSLCYQLEELSFYELIDDVDMAYV